MDKAESYPYQAQVAVKGPFKLTAQEAWFYRDGTSLDVIANVTIGDATYTVIVDVPTKGKQRRSK